MERADVLHRTLERQLRRLGLAPETMIDAAAWPALLRAVSRTYQGADDDRYTLERSIEISSGEMRALHAELSAQARHDPLTGMPNRMALLEQLTSALAVCRREGGGVAILFIDLDGFKLVNDRLGHACGDELLIRAAERIRRVVRVGDVVARLGGDEFVVLVRTADEPGEAMRAGRRITQALEQPFRIREQDCFVSASVGIATMGDEPTTSEDLLRQADLAMYRAKDEGSGLVVLFDAGLQARVEEQAELEAAVRGAVVGDQLVLHYQPLVGAGDRVAAYEALVRWDRPGHGLVGPDAFIPVAERSRLIVAIGRWVLHRACADAAGWPDGTSVCVNLSARELAEDGVVASVTDALQASGLAASRLVVELTESTMLADKDTVPGNLARLRRLGVQIAIDDFGTGYSSLSHLRAMPATCLKIDRSFVHDVDREAHAQTIVGAIVTMAHALGLTVVVEGVERPAQLDAVRRLGCDLAQGFLLAPPAPLADLGAAKIDQAA